MYNILIIGGGITGLSAACEVQRARPDLSYCLVEATGNWGGKVTSQVIATQGKQFLVDGGPDTLVTRKPETWALTKKWGSQARYRLNSIFPAGRWPCGAWQRDIPWASTSLGGV